MANVAKIETCPVRNQANGELRLVGRVLGRGRPDGVANYCVVLHVTPRDFGPLNASGALDEARAWCAANGVEVQS